jgi:uncharacterized coiled-coil protein SlyX
MDDDRMQRAEETLAHQSQQIHDLSDMVIAQSREIEALHKDIKKLQGKMEAANYDAQQGDSGSLPPADQKPPHY